MLLLLFYCTSATHSDLELQMAREDCLLLLSECHGPCWELVDYYAFSNVCRIRHIDGCEEPFKPTGFCTRCRRRTEDVGGIDSSSFWFRIAVCAVVIVSVAAAVVRSIVERKRLVERSIRSVALDF